MPRSIATELSKNNADEPRSEDHFSPADPIVGFSQTSSEELSGLETATESATGVDVVVSVDRGDSRKLGSDRQATQEGIFFFQSRHPPTAPGPSL